MSFSEMRENKRGTIDGEREREGELSSLTAAGMGTIYDFHYQ